jgi:hypothetical protein
MTSVQNVNAYLETRLADSKTHFERALDCKHTPFDDLYPYMTEHPQFFWYKRYVAWSELLTLVSVAEGVGLEWESIFSDQQVEYIRSRVMSASVLDHWFGAEKHETVRD